MSTFLFFATWIGLAVVCAVIAPSRGRSAAAWFFIALLVSGLFALIVLLALPPLREETKPRLPVRPSAVEEKVCPQCAETIKAAAKVCRFCGHKFATPTPDVTHLTEEYRGIPFTRNSDLSVSASINGETRRWRNIMLFRAEVDALVR